MIRGLMHMLRYCRPYWRLYAVGTGALFIVDVLDVSAPMLVKWAIDHVRYGAPAAGTAIGLLPPRWFGEGAFMHGMWVYFALYVAAVAVTGFFRYFMSMRYSEAGITLAHDLRGRFFAHVQRLPASFHDRSKIGEQMSLAVNDIDATRFFYSFGLLMLLDTLFYFIFVPVVMASISVKLLLASLATLPLIPVIVSRLAHRIEHRYDELQAQFAILSEGARESYSGAKVIKSYAREEQEIARYERKCGEYLRRGLRLAVVTALQSPLLTLMLALADLVVIAYGGSLVMRGLPVERALLAQGTSPEGVIAGVRAAGGITTGDFVVFFQYLIRLSGPMIGFGWVVTLYQRGRVSMGRIEKVLGVDSGIQDTGRPAGGMTADMSPRLTGRVEIRDLTFRYAPGLPPALAGVDLDIPAGATVGLVGGVGSGKSTLLSLLSRIYDPPPGTILMDGRDVRSIPLKALRTQVAAVPQEAFLFSETIEENIALGAPEGSTRAWIEECARVAMVDTEIRAFPKQYRTMLGEKGVNLSGGQKQRVSLARGLAVNAPILVLDDCLSAVDAKTEQAILDGLRGLPGTRTVFIASHRISTLRHADEIIVLWGGRIVERGTHADLLAAGGTYADLHVKQSLEAELAVE